MPLFCSSKEIMRQRNITSFIKLVCQEEGILFLPATCSYHNNTREIKYRQIFIMHCFLSIVEHIAVSKRETRRWLHEASHNFNKFWLAKDNKPVNTSPSLLCASSTWVPEWEMPKIKRCCKKRKERWRGGLSGMLYASYYNIDLMGILTTNMLWQICYTKCPFSHQKSK